MKSSILATGGVALHVLVLLGPSLLLGGIERVLWDPAAIAFLLLATVFCGCDLATLRFSVDRPAVADGDSPANRAARRLALLTGIVLLAIFWSGLGERATLAGGSSVIGIAAGGVLMLAGSLLRLAAIAALGPQFRTEITVRPEARLVRRGIYRVVRHPSETGLLAVALGTAILLGSAAAAGLWLAALLPLVLWRLALEERQLDARFGTRYQRYRLRVRRLLPLVY
jgi:protein-S-isoprenylcysteine O-methyltransferase Ste14